MGEAYRLAETVIAELNGATRVLCPPFHGAHIESMVELLDNGTGRGIVYCKASLHGTNDYPAIFTFLSGQAAPINAVLPALRSNKDVQEALFYLGAGEIPEPTTARSDDRSRSAAVRRRYGEEVDRIARYQTAEAGCSS
jgi:hypothetical protein